VSWLDAVYGAKASSDYSWNRTFTGQVLDVETGLMLYRNRYYHSSLGRFITRDPINYKANDLNVYRYCFNLPLIKLDIFGLAENMSMCQTETSSIELASESFIPNVPSVRFGAYGEVGGSIVINSEYSYCRKQCDCTNEFVDEESASMSVAGEISATIGVGLSFDISTGRFKTGVSGYAGLRGTLSGSIGISGDASTNRCNGDDGEAKTTCGVLVISIEAGGGARVSVHIGGVQRSLGADVFMRGSVTYGICLTCTPSSCTYSGPSRQDASIVAGVRFCYGRCWEYTWGISF
jgi:RHS repeat-associated protein